MMPLPQTTQLQAIDGPGRLSLGTASGPTTTTNTLRHLINTLKLKSLNASRMSLHMNNCQNDLQVVYNHIENFVALPTFFRHLRS